MENSGTDSASTRSVSAEADLKPGVYSVVCKVTATRFASSDTAEEAILKYAVSRKEKLLHVGQCYDLAHAKGNRRAMEAAAKEQVKLDVRRKQRDGLRRARTFNAEEKERARLRRVRVEEGMKVRWGEYAMARRARATRKRERRERDAKASAGKSRGESNNDEEAVSTVDNVSLTSRSEAEKAEEKTTAERGGETQHDTDTPPIERDIANPPPDVTADAARDNPDTDTATASKQLTNIKLKDTPHSPISDLPTDDEAYESSLAEPEELDDTDFAWDSDLDGPLLHSSDDEEEVDPRTEIFAEDTWNAVCVLGLRVYSRHCAASVRVVKGRDGLA
ncbi:hypothetical protein LTR53_005321 [Teratosphaeriaceae sp. CCFEE 6253]|nr:hypothetical protein LTR53_005321 [Teratosphaeriaceae sp. CCFEE 6253]